MIDKKYYKDALDVQNASNGSGIIWTLGIIVKEIEEDYKANPVMGVRQPHPVMTMFADKLADLCVAREAPYTRTTDESALLTAKVLCIVREHLIAEGLNGGTDAFNGHPLIRFMTYHLFKETEANNNRSLNQARYECEDIVKEV